MKKSILMTLLAAAMTACLVGCSFTSHVTTTETTTDEDGNTTTVTTETTNDNGNVTTETTSEFTPASAVEEEEQEPERISTELHFTNETSVEITGLYFVTESTEDWGDELLGENAPLKNGETMTFHDVSFDPENSVCKFKFTTETNETTFGGIDLNAAEDPTNITFSISESGEDFQLSF